MSMTDVVSSSGARRPRRTLPGPTSVKLVISVVLLLALVWVVLLGAEYLSTGEPISELNVVPAPVADLFESPTFTYSASIDGVQTPMGVAVGPNGLVYVTETGGARLIHVYDSTGAEVNSFAPAETEPSGRALVYIAISPEGRVYVSDRTSAAIYMFAADGTPEGQVTAPESYEDWQPLGLAFDLAGNLYITDVAPDKHRIIVLDPDLNLKLSFGTQGEESGQFWYPNGIAVDSLGRIYVADSNNGRVQAFDEDGKLLFKINRGMSASNLSLPRGIAVDSKNRLLISDTSRGAVQTYQVLDSAGTDTTEAPLEYMDSFSGEPGDFFRYPNGLALDGKGQLYIVDSSNNRVQVWKY